MTQEAIHATLTRWLGEAQTRNAEPLRHICRSLAADLAAGTHKPDDAGAVLLAATEMLPDPGCGKTTGPAELTDILRQMQQLEQSIAQATVPETALLLSSTIHASRCLNTAIRKTAATSTDH